MATGKGPGSSGGTGTSAGTASSRPRSVVSGPPLRTEPGLGPLTLPGFLREVTTAYAGRPALILRTAGGVTSWTYAQLWDQATAVARALRASGVGRGGRVGVLMTNRPEWLAAVFGTALAGGVAVALSTFSTPPELDHLIRASGIGTLLYERNVAGRDFTAILADLEPATARPAPAGLRSARFPYLRHLAVLGAAQPAGAAQSWDGFLARGQDEPAELVAATAAAVRPADPALLLYSSGSTSMPKGILSAHRAVSIQLWRFRRMYEVGPEDSVRAWTANGLFWSGNFGMALGTTLASGGALVLQQVFDAAAALDLIQAEQVN